MTLPEHTPNKDSSGYLYIYGTSEPRGDDCLGDIHGHWNEFDSGGGRRGRLLAKRPFDDGRCYQINTGSISRSARWDMAFASCFASCSRLFSSHVGFH